MAIEAGPRNREALYYAVVGLALCAINVVMSVRRDDDLAIILGRATVTLAIPALIAVAPATMKKLRTRRSLASRFFWTALIILILAVVGRR